MTDHITTKILFFASFGLLAACTTVPNNSASLATVDAPIATSSETTVKIVEVTSGEAEKICKNQVTTGSKFTKKVCKTQAEWNALQVQASGMTRSLQQAGAANDIAR